MTTIRAVIRDRRIDVPAPQELPDGTAVLVTIGADRPNDESPMSPEEIAATLAAMEKVETKSWTAEERAAREADKQARRDWEKTNFVEHAEKLRRLWE
jgi:hypothetical protein